MHNMGTQLHTWEKEWVADRGILFQMEAEPGESLLYAIRHKLEILGCVAASAVYGSSELKIFDLADSESPARFEDWHKLNDSEHVYINRYNPDRAFWWLEKWERPQASKVPPSLRSRVDVSWRLVASHFADRQNESAWPTVDKMLDHLTKLPWVATEPKLFGVRRPRAEN